MGIVPKLAQLLKRSQHPFLQAKSLAVLTRMVHSVSRDSFTVFFNEEVIIFDDLMDCLES
jgi:hypothetical protein